MSDFTQLIERNQQFAANYQGNLAGFPQFSTIVLTCADARVDPAHFLGLELGDSLVFRSAGARVSRGFARDVGILWTMASRVAGDKFGGFELAIIHHTKCGFERLANADFQQVLNKNLGLDLAEIETLAISDHEKAIQEDIERLRQWGLLPGTLTVSGHIYDVDDGIVRQVVAPVPLQGNS